MLRSPLAPFLTLLFATAALVGCGAESPPRAVQEPAPAEAAPAAGPSLEEAARATIVGIYDHPVTLQQGRWEGEPFAPGSASRPSVELVPDFLVTGQLSGDATPEAIVLLTERSGGSGTFGYLAILARREGEVVNLGTASVGDRVQVRQGRIAAGRIRLDVVQQGPDDAACCPSQLAARIWELGPEGLDEISSKVLGTLSLEHLQGSDWVITHFDRETVAPPEGDLTLSFEEDRIAGSAGCNRYFAPVKEGQVAGDIEVGEVGSTRKACSEEAMALEQRFLQAVEGVVRYSFLAGKLALSYQQDDVFGVLLFAPRPQAEANAG